MFLVVWNLNTLRPIHNGRHFADDIFKCIFLNENISIAIKISLKFVSKVPIDNIPALVQIMAWRRPGDKPLSYPMIVSLPTHICVIRPQWVNFDVQELICMYQYSRSICVKYVDNKRTISKTLILICHKASHLNQILYKTVKDSCDYIVDRSLWCLLIFLMIWLWCFVHTTSWPINWLKMNM